MRASGKRRRLFAAALSGALACAWQGQAFAQIDDSLILLPPAPGERDSPQKLLGQTLLPLVVDCINAKTVHAHTRRGGLAIFEYLDGVGFPAVSSAEAFLDEANKAQVGQDTPYTLVMIVFEQKGAPSGRYTNGALVYSSTFDYCLIDMPSRAITARDTFTAHPPAEIAGHSNAYSELRRKLAEYIASIPLRKAD